MCHYFGVEFPFFSRVLLTTSRRNDLFARRCDIDCRNVFTEVFAVFEILTSKAGLVCAQKKTGGACALPVHFYP
jgi:hypothetical protein